MSLLVRLKPYNTKKGHVTRIYMIGPYRFYEDRGWYEFEDEAYAKNVLRRLHQDHYDPESPELFDVCTREQAEELDEREAARQAELVKATARKPLNVMSARVHNRTTSDSESGDLTSADVKSPPEESKKMIDPAEDEHEEAGDEDEGRALEVGRVGGKPAHQGRSTPPSRKRR